MSDDLKQTLDELEQEVLEELSPTHHPYEVIVSYTCSFDMPDDEYTEITIKTKSKGVSVASSLEDATSQIKIENEHSKKAYASYVLGFLRKNLSKVDMSSAVLTYDGEPIIKRMTDEEIDVWEKDIIDANAY